MKWIWAIIGNRVAFNDEVTPSVNLAEKVHDMKKKRLK